MNAAVIPARGGSKRVPLKNLAAVGGKPLIVRAVEAAAAAEAVHGVYVSTDHPEIAAVSQAAGAVVIARPPELSGDDATSEAVLLHALREIEAAGEFVGVLVFLQCTSPFTRPEDIDHCVTTLFDADVDCAFSVVRTHSGYWTGTLSDPRCLNYATSAPRQPRQKVPPMWRETGGIYAMRAASFKRLGTRFCGAVRMVEVEDRSAFEIDNPWDLELAQRIAAVESDTCLDGFRHRHEFQIAPIPDTPAAGGG